MRLTYFIGFKELLQVYGPDLLRMFLDRYFAGLES